MRIIALLLLVSALPAWSLEDYYGATLAQWDGKPSDQFKVLLFEVLNNYHLQAAGQPDQLSASCPKSKECLVHTPIGYDSARREMFGRLYLQKHDGLFAVPDMYCNDVLDEKDFPKGKGPGPNKIPSNDIMNTEHAWPQSRFSKKFPSMLQKSDMHILFPVSSRTNSLRSNFPYGVVTEEKSQICAESALGTTAEGTVAFLPPTVHRGKFARAVFYFSARYRMVINDEQEHTLRQWHHDDPVTEAEKAHNQEVYELQQDRNPFIDHPEWVDAVPNF
jgi:deoxyribonuclease-1